MSIAEPSDAFRAGAILAELLEIEDGSDPEPGSHGTARQAKIDLAADVIAVTLGPSGAPLENEREAPMIYLEARPEGWRVYLHSDDSGDCAIVNLMNDGRQTYEPPRNQDAG